MVVREIDMLLAEPNENPFAKFLSLRVPPAATVVLSGADANRQPASYRQPGEAGSVAAQDLLISTGFKRPQPRRHILSVPSKYCKCYPGYLKATVEEKEQLELLGSSLLIICLESVKVWAEWVPVSPNGSESAFKKGYNTLLERGVAFCEQQYYKKADYER